jgi:hypothetical protein
VALRRGTEEVRLRRPFARSIALRVAGSLDRLPKAASWLTPAGFSAVSDGGGRDTVPGREGAAAAQDRRTAQVGETEPDLGVRVSAQVRHANGTALRIHARICSVRFGGA